MDIKLKKQHSERQKVVFYWWFIPVYETDINNKPTRVHRVQG